MHAILIVFATILVLCFLDGIRCDDIPRKKRHNQEVRRRQETASSTSERNENPEVTVDIVGETKFAPPKIEPASSSGSNDNDSSGSDCSPCVGTDRKGQYTAAALKLFWQKAYNLADACICHFLKSKQDDALGKALAITLQSAPGKSKKMGSKVPSLAKTEMKTIVKNWETLGPINVGKLELDGDPSFHFPEQLSYHSHDIVTYILGMADNQSVFTELLNDGKTSWKKFTSKANGQVSCVL